MLQHEKWLAKAEEDLAFANLGLREKYFSQVCFLSQQVVEKSFKAFLISKGHAYPRLHKVLALASLCREIKKDIEPYRSDLKLLDEFYIPTRYPDAIPGGLSSGFPDEKDARQAIEVARKILTLVRGKVNEEKS